MPFLPIKRALISAYDKSGLVPFARALAGEFHVQIISTGKSAAHLREHDIPVTLVEEVTGAPEMLDGRVKTLHPSVHAAILADRDNPEHMRQLAQAGIQPIDLVVVGLYPFESTIAQPDCTFAEAIEMIDIGGPCLLRAAAKNHRHVLVVPNTSEYDVVLAALRDGDERRIATLREKCASAVFRLTCAYDRAVGAYLSEGFASPADARDPLDQFRAAERCELRYGENPHQKAWFFALSASPRGPVLPAHEDGDQLSYNNYLDADAALALCGEITRQQIRSFPTQRSSEAIRDAACLFIKHNNPCGVGVAPDPVEAYRRAYLGDANAAMGGVLACNFEVTEAFAEKVCDSLTLWGKDAGAGAFFLEVWLAEGFDPAARQIIRTRKQWGSRVRLLSVGDMALPVSGRECQLRSVAGGLLVQSADHASIEQSEWTVASKRQPTDREWADLKLAWLCAKHSKSNAIALARHGQLLACGAGQTSRVVACSLALDLARGNSHLDSNHGDKCHCVAASDGFFPFRDGPDLLMDGGVSAIIQPGGSKRDADTIAACDERGVALIVTGTRHFRH